MAQVTIYTTPTCVYCQAAKRFFAEKGVAYTEHNVAADAEKRKEMIERSGQMGVPVILVDNEMVVGFNQPKIKQLLGISYQFAEPTLNKNAEQARNTEARTSWFFRFVVSCCL